MENTQTLETQSTAVRPEHESETHLANSSRRAAAIEAAYILEAVRK
jgi:hypothetical protein